MEIGIRIKNLRLENGMTQQDLATKIGVSTVSVQCWEKGSKSPSLQASVSLAHLFHISLDDLIGNKRVFSDDYVLSLSERSLIKDYRLLDHYGKLAVDRVCSIEKARVLEMSNNNQTVRYIPKYYTPSAAGSSVPLDGEEFEMIPVNEKVPIEADFAVRIQGNSMYPHIKDGDTVFVKKNCELHNGDVGIFSVDGAMYCKQYYLDEYKNLTLISVNPELKDTNVTVSADSNSDVKCFGKVILKHKVSLPEYFLIKTDS